MAVHFRPSLELLAEAQRESQRRVVAHGLRLVYSFLSVTEAGLYHLTAQLAREAAERGGAVGDEKYAADLAARIVAERVPVLLTEPGQVAADTKSTCTWTRVACSSGRGRCGTRTSAWGRSPTRTSDTCSRWARSTGSSTSLGVPDWVAQRLWLGSILFLAGLGMLYLFRTLGLRGPGRSRRARVHAEPVLARLRGRGSR